MRDLAKEIPNSRRDDPVPYLLVNPKNVCRSVHQRCHNECPNVHHCVPGAMHVSLVSGMIIDHVLRGRRYVLFHFMQGYLFDSALLNGQYAYH